jgi:RNA polymerase sigma-70 factor, ECF subfamily
MTESAEHAFRRHYRDVYGFVRRRSASAEDAEEITADVFEAAVSGLDSFEPGPTPVLAWLYTVARRRLVDEARRSARAPRAPVDPVGAGYGAGVASALRDAIAVLPEGQRTVVVLKLVHGWSFREIAEREGCTEAACKMRLARGLERLRTDLERQGVDS